jgi:nitrogen fixation/metabolism regulation signal transduction histidine kinase
MATDDQSVYAGLLVALDAPDWSSVLEGVGTADAWLRAATPGDPRIDNIVAILVGLASHQKWEIRRAVANSAAQALHPAFEGALARLATDDNTRVRQAAAHASLRRRDWQNASMLGKQHEDRINLTLDDIEIRFGQKGRDAVKRASEQIANTFSRELYHEVIKLLSPLAASADRLQMLLSDESTTRAELTNEAVRIERRVAHLRTVLDAMRAYTAQPKLVFAVEPLKDIVEEAAALVREAQSVDRRQPPINIRVDATISIEVSRARLIQAFTNVLVNAIESYDGLDVLNPVVVRAEAEEGRVIITIKDAGRGMSKEALADAGVLFATNKPNGTGFGLPLAIKIIESEHMGRLSLESDLGRGTVVRAIIPTQRRQGFT